MDWQLAISRNRDALLRIVAALFVLGGFTEGANTATLPRHIYRAILRVLRPAESALRRLIIIAARGIVLALPAARPMPVDLVSKGGAPRLPAFTLVDPLKRFAPFTSYDEDALEIDDTDVEDGHGHGHGGNALPRISVPGLFDPVFMVPPAATPHDHINAALLLRRLGALKRALENLSTQARRLARWKARRDLALRQQIPFKPRRLSPFRPGSPPGTKITRKHEVDHVLRECHLLMLDMLATGDTS